jgi:hypothetical protein
MLFIGLRFGDHLALRHVRLPEAYTLPHETLGEHINLKFKHEKSKLKITLIWLYLGLILYPIKLSVALPYLDYPFRSFT